MRDSCAGSFASKYRVTAYVRGSCLQVLAQSQACRRPGRRSRRTYFRLRSEIPRTLSMTSLRLFRILLLAGLVLAAATAVRALQEEPPPKAGSGKAVVWRGWSF